MPRTVHIPKKWLWLAALALAIILARSAAGTQLRIGPTFSQEEAEAAWSDIPEQAIRLRIIANSDAPYDQQLKREVRDRVISEVGKQLYQVQNISDARAILQRELPHFQQIAQETVREKGFSYPVRTEYGLVPFPTKLYGDRVYPAGNYEAVRITIGKGEGQNWWCVLFPALCFVDVANGDAIQGKPRDMAPSSPPLTTIEVEKADGTGKEEVQVRSALLDGWHKWLKKIQAFFS